MVSFTVFNKQNTNDDFKRQRQLSISMTNSIEVEGIQYKINNINYIKSVNIVNKNPINKRSERTIVNTCTKLQFPKLREYTPRFSQTIKKCNLNNSTNHRRIKNKIIFSYNNKNKFINKINKNINAINKIKDNIRKIRNYNINNINNKSTNTRKYLCNTFKKNSRNNFSLNLFNKSNDVGKTINPIKHIYNLKINND